MKIAILPEDAMIIRSIIKNHGHTPISPTNFDENTKHDGHIDTNKPPYNMKKISNTQVSCELPSGVRGRLKLYEDILEKAEAGIILDKKPTGCSKIYSELNNIILFGEIECANTYNYLRYVLKNKDMPILELKYPKTQQEIIEMINEIIKFLEDLENRSRNMKTSKNKMKIY